MNRNNWHPINHAIVNSLRAQKQGGLMVVSSGINIAQVTSLLLSYFLQRSNYVVILTNFTQPELELMDSSLSDFAFTNQINNNKEYCLDIVRLGKQTSDKRGILYQQGGVFHISGQVLMQDMLNQTLQPIIITHLIIQQAHNIRSKVDYDSWITNYIKITKPEVFILALSNKPQVLVCRQNIQTILRTLYIDNVLPWPINRAEIVCNLKQDQIKWNEFQLKLSSNVESIQNSLINIMEECIREVNHKLQRTALHTELIIQSNQYQLAILLQKLNLRQDVVDSQFFKDIFVLKKLLINLTSMNPYQYFYIFQKIIQDAPIDSIWFISDSKIDKAYASIQSTSQSRVFHFVPLKEPIVYHIPIDGKLVDKQIKLKIVFNLINQPKFNLINTILEQLHKNEADEHQRIWIWMKNPNNVPIVQQQLNSYYRLKDKVNALSQFNYLRQALKDVVLQGKQQQVEALLFPKQESPKQQIKSKIVLKSKKSDEAKQNTEQSKKDELLLLHLLSHELDTFYMDLNQKREQLLLHQNIIKGSYEYQILPEELLNIDIKQINDKVDENGHIIDYDEDGIIHNMSIVVNSLENECQRENFIHQYKPNHIVLMEPNNGFIKELLVQGCQSQFYLMIYQDSTESQMYYKDKLDEEQSFEQLILEQTNFVKSYELPQEAIVSIEMQQTSTRQGRGEQFFQQVDKKPIVIVDYREFRSEIPARLYYSGYTVIPMMLKVGDIILSNNTAIERKCVETGDLIESVNSNRLDEQLKKLNQFENPFLLIEFSDNIGFSLEAMHKTNPLLNNNTNNNNNNNNKYTNTRLLFRLFELVQKYQKISILWSKGPDDTVKIIHELKQTIAINTPDVNQFRNVVKESLQIDKVDQYFTQLSQIVV